MGNLCSVSISLDDLISGGFNSIAGHASYTIKLEENLRTLGIELNKLKEKRDDITTKILLAEQNHLKRTNQVRGWLSRVETLISEIENLQKNGPQEIQKLCLGGCFSKNCKSSYKFAKNVAKKVEEVAEYITSANLEEIAEEVPAATADLRPNVPTVGLESTLDSAWRFLEEEDVGMIGLYGMGGVGKTTILNQINNKYLKSTSLGFNVVIWITVSKDHRLEKVQDDIGEKLGFSSEKWRSKRVDQKAVNILSFLSGKKFVLLLDDIWERVDLVSIGIPLPSRENGCKVVFTSRSLEVCGQMEAQKKIKVECLNADRAWKLFEEKVGKEVLDGNSYIRELAQEVVKGCGGLPLALITIGRAMSCKKTPREWEHAIEVLRKPYTNAHMGREVFPLLKFSYDSLDNDLLRNCFLYCRLFPEDYKMEKAHLLDLWIGEGFLDGEPYNKGFDIIGSLTYASLLEESDHNYVKMHDVMRDMALWIASEHEEEKSMVETSVRLRQLPDAKKWEGMKRVSLMGNQITNLKQVPTSCGDLRTLLLRSNKLVAIDSNFFQSMSGLTVLDLSSNKNLGEFPVGILQLTSLQSLNLSFTSISKLPAELKRLKMLKCLNLTRTPLEVIPRGVIQSFSKLQVLRMMLFKVEKRGQKGEDNVLSGTGHEYLAEELNCLQYLQELNITIRSSSALESLSSSQKLARVAIEVNLMSFKESEFLNISSLLNMKNVEVMKLSQLESLREIRIQGSVVASKSCFHSLHTLFLYRCSKLREVSWVFLAPSLISLRAYSCDNLEAIIDRESLSQVPESVRNVISFAKLEEIVLEKLPRLESIYADSLLFPCLRKMRVIDCPELKKLPLDSRSAMGQNVVIEGSRTWQRDLLWDDDATQNAFLPCFHIVE